MDKLHRPTPGQPGNSDEEKRISPGDLLVLPPAQRKIMRILLRHTTLTYPALREAVEALPDAERIDHAELDKMLKLLVRDKWLIQTEEAQTVTYQVGTIHKTGPFNESQEPQDSDSAQAETPGTGKRQPSQRRDAGLERLGGFWDKLESGPTDEKEDGAVAARRRSGGIRSGLFEELSRKPAPTPEQETSVSGVDEWAGSPPRERPPTDQASAGYVSSLHAELAAQKPGPLPPGIESSPQGLDELPRADEPGERPDPTGKWRISRLFDWLLGKSRSSEGSDD